MLVCAMYICQIYREKNSLCRLCSFIEAQNQKLLSSSCYQRKQPWYYDNEELNHWTSRICIINCTFRSDSKDWKQNKQTETINNQCIRNKWKINEETDCYHQQQQKVLEKIDLSRLICDQGERIRALIK